MYVLLATVLMPLLHRDIPDTILDVEWTNGQTLKEAHQQTGWIETCGRTVGDGVKGYGPLIKAYTTFLLSKLRFHRHHPEFNGLFEYEEYISLKNIDDPNEG